MPEVPKPTNKKGSKLGPSGLHCWPSRHLPPPPQHESGQNFNLNFVLNKTCLNSNFIFQNKFGLHKDCILHLPFWQSVSTVIHLPSHFHLVRSFHKSCAFPSLPSLPTSSYLTFFPSSTKGKHLLSSLHLGNGHRCGSDHALKDYALCKDSLFNSHCLYHLEMTLWDSKNWMDS